MRESKEPGEHGITIVGLGPGPLRYLTKEAESVLLKHERVLFRFAEHPVYAWLKSVGRNPASMGRGYLIPGLDPASLYKMFAGFVVECAARHGSACYAVPGNPGVLEDTVGILRKRAVEKGISLRIVAGMSFIDQIYAEMGFDPGAGLQIVLPRTHLVQGRFTTTLPMLICQPMPLNGGPDTTTDFKVVWNALLEKYPVSHPITVISTPGMPNYELHSETVRLADLLDVPTSALYFASLYLPACP